MIERKFVQSHMKEFLVTDFVKENLKNVGLSNIKLIRTPLGDKIIIKASRPGLVVGRGGENIQRLTEELKKRFNLENPQIEIEEIENIGLDANVMAEKIVSSLERFGINRFKGIGHKALTDIMNAGARGVEILISGKVPSARAKTWRFYKGYLKKCGDIAVSYVKVSNKTAVLKSGAIGVKVSIMLPDTRLPDDIIYHEENIEDITGTKEAKEIEKKVERTEREYKKKEVKGEKGEKREKREVKKKITKKEDKAVKGKKQNTRKNKDQNKIEKEKDVENKSEIKSEIE